MAFPNGAHHTSSRRGDMESPFNNESSHRHLTKNTYNLQGDKSCMDIIEEGHVNYELGCGGFFTPWHSEANYF